jgi:transcriptional regulator with XRE-family HTH domain
VTTTSFRSDLQKVLAERVRAGLYEKSWTYVRLAKVSGYSKEYISTMMSGRRAGTLEAWDALLKSVGRGVS